ncbi:MAG: hypothetical protein WCO17_03660 [Betaproteobacteria bacterium]
MSEPEFFPSHAPHHVEMPEGSNVARSPSAHVGTDIRRVQRDEDEVDEEITLQAHEVLVQAKDTTINNVVKLPPQTPKELKTATIGTASEAAKAASGNAAGSGTSAQADEEEFETEEAVEMDFPARVIQLKIENDVVRTQLQALDAMMKAR